MMITQYLEVGIGIAVFAAVFWWMFTLTIKSQSQRKQEIKQEPSAKRLVHQPWDNDRAGGRGNR
jgi:hypothetical protein